MSINSSKDNNHKSLLQYLLSIESKGIKMGLQRTNALKQACGNPDQNLSIIQVAGTNGKGSTCAMIANILIEAGYNVGLFTSPHLVMVNERIRINGKPILDNEIAEFIKLYKKNIEDISASFFEVITIMGFWYFKKHKVDYAIMETGLGGRLDSVTVCTPKLSVITSISMDHSEILGDSLDKITKEKAGIIKKNIPCITIKHPKQIADIIANQCSKKQSNLIISNNCNRLAYTPGLKSDVQLENAHLSQVAVNTLLEDICDDIIIRGIEKTIWHGRNQMIQKDPLVIFDVAHNASGIKSFIKYIKTFNCQKKRLVISLQSRKNIKSEVDMLINVFDEIILCETHNKRTMTINDLKSNFKNSSKVVCIKSEFDAIKDVLDNSKKDDLVGIIGTHHFGDAISEIFNISFNLL